MESPRNFLPPQASNSMPSSRGGQLRISVQNNAGSSGASPRSSLNTQTFKMQKNGFEANLSGRLRIDSAPTEEEMNTEIPSQKKFDQILQNVENVVKTQTSILNADSIAGVPTARPEAKVKQTRKKKKGSTLYSGSIASETNYMELYNQLREKYQALLAENLRQQEVFKIRQEAYMKREQKSKELETELGMKMRESMVARGIAGEKMQEIISMKEKIEDGVSVLKTDMQKILEAKEGEFERKMEEMMRRFEKELANERKKNSSGEKEWKDKSKSLKKELDNSVAQVIKVDELNHELSKENQRLKIQFAAQEDDRTYLAKHIAKTKRDNEKLKDETKRLHEELQNCNNIIKEMQLNRSSVVPSPSMRSFATPRESSVYTANHSSVLDPEEKERRFLEANNKLKKLLETERKNIRQIRAQNIRILEERTELEIFLRSCIEDVKEDVSRRKGENKGESDEFKKRERQRVIDLLLSKERVIKILYERMFDKPSEREFDYEPTQLDALLSSRKTDQELVENK